MTTDAAETVVGTVRRTEREEWFDNECAKAVEERNEARSRMLQRKTRQTTEMYREKRRLAAKECKKKKRLFQKQRIAELEGIKDQNKISKFYQRVRESRKGFQPSSVFCKDNKVS